MYVRRDKEQRMKVKIVIEDGYATRKECRGGDDDGKKCKRQFFDDDNAILVRPRGGLMVALV